MCTVVNLKKEPYDQYIGRAGHGEDGYFGNPFKLLFGEPRGGSLVRYRKWFNERIADDPVFREKVKALKGKRLGCFCKPYPCHGDILAEYANDPERYCIYYQLIIL